MEKIYSVLFSFFFFLVGTFQFDLCRIGSLADTSVLITRLLTSVLFILGVITRIIYSVWSSLTFTPKNADIAFGIIGAYCK